MTDLGLGSLVVQLGKGTRKLAKIRRSAFNASSDVAELTDKLNYLQRLLHTARRIEDRLDQQILYRCFQSACQIAKDLEKLVDRVEGFEKQRNEISSKFFEFRDWDNDVQSLDRKINDVRMDLIGLFTLASVTCPGQSEINQTHKHSTVLEEIEEGPDDIEVQSDKTEAELQQDDPIETLDSTSDKYAPTPRAVAMYKRRRLQNKDCISRSCTCVCHTGTSVTSRFWAVDYVFPQRPCTVSSCDLARYGWKLRLSLSRFGFWRAVEFGLYLQTTPGKFLLHPCLKVDQIVPFTSSGFEVIWKAETGQITFHTARDQLIGLERSDPTFKRHVDPNGKSYIETLLRYPWGVGRTHCQFSLLKLLIHDFDMTLGTMHSGFLSKCASWIGEGPHLDLLESLLHLGLEIPDLDSQTWPDPCDPNWISESLTPDPFFLDYTKICSMDNQGFAGMSPLHQAVLHGTRDSVDRWTSVCEKDEQDCLERRPMHLAVSAPSHLKILIDAGHDLDAQDKYGITPLMYAAAMNQTESVVVLIEKGSSLGILDGRLKRTALRYACARRNWDLVLTFLDAVERIYGREACSPWAELGLLDYMHSRNRILLEDDSFLLKIIPKVDSVNFLHNSLNVDNNNLMHLTQSDSEALIFLKNGFHLVNHTNSAGESPLSVAARNGNAALIRLLMRAGARVNPNNDPRSHALVVALDQLQQSSGESRRRLSEVVRECLTECGSLVVPDHCRCPCSSPGYLAILSLPWTTEPHLLKGTIIPIWSLEFLSILSDLGRLHERTEVLLALIRKAEFDNFGMTHLCAGKWSDSLVHKILFEDQRIEDDDADDILDEEAEFISHLDDLSDKRRSLTFDTLLLQWFQLIKSSLQARETRFKESPEASARPREQSKMFYVDRKRDTFVGPNIDMTIEPGPLHEVFVQIMDYVEFIEHGYYCENDSHLLNDTRDEWYQTRHRWLQLLVIELEIPRAKILQSLRVVRQGPYGYDCACDFGELHIEDAISHFDSCWGNKSVEE